MSLEATLLASPKRSGTSERIPCWLCGWPIVMRTTGSERIYLTCMECGMKVHIHSAAGAGRLHALVGDTTQGLEPRGVIRA
jgi:hypothetical protein